MKHADGSRCLEGKRVVPRNFKSCCQDFKAATKRCDAEVRVEYYGPDWVICLANEAGGGGIEIYYCPWCGQNL